MRPETVVAVAGLRSACTSTEALAAARSVIEGLDGSAAAWRIEADGGFDLDGRGHRWQVEFDLPERGGTASVALGFTRRESDGVWEDGVATIREVPFPAPGSNLERMAVAGELSARRIEAIWRQQVTDRLRLPDDVPDSSVVAARLEAPVSSANARRTRLYGVIWEVTVPGRTHRIRFEDLA